VKSWTGLPGLPGLSRWPPASFAVPGENWQQHLAAADFQRIAAAADRLGFDSVEAKCDLRCDDFHESPAGGPRSFSPSDSQL
jgi:hypothetical protein